MATAQLSAVEQLLWPEGFGRETWMVVDAARDPRVMITLVNSYLEYSCLYSGNIPAPLQAAAPYLVRLEAGGYYGRQLLERAWGNSWGILLHCDTSLEKLRRHLRQFLVVRHPEGRQLVFRYYDPRVLRVYLPTCNESELRTIFGPIEEFYVEDADSSLAWKFRRDRKGLLLTEKADLSKQG